MTARLRRNAVKKQTQITFAAQLRGALEARGWTAYRLGRESGVSLPVISRYLAAKREPTLAIACRLADALGVPVDDLRPR